MVSNDEYGAVNPAYPAELQPRDRSRTASQLQIQEMSRRLNPRLLADSPTAQNGAPIIRGRRRGDRRKRQEPGYHRRLQQRAGGGV